MAVTSATSIAYTTPPVTDPSFCKGQGDIQSGLMVVTVAGAVLSLIPPCRLIGVAITRSAAVISALDLCQDRWSKPGSEWKKRAIMCVKVAATTLGVAAIVTSSPALLVAALATDIAVQIFEMIKASSNSKRLLHLAFLAVNITVLTGILLVSWELLLAASIASIVAMVCLGIYIAFKAETWKDFVNMACYFALAGTGIASGVMVSRLYGNYEYGELPDGRIVGQNEWEEGWRYHHSADIPIGGFLETEHFPTLPIGTHTVVAAERID